MKKYYFTYGFEDHPFVGGWTEVEAENYNQAVELFCMIHPRKSEHDCVNCAEIYDEEHFKKNNNVQQRQLRRICTRAHIHQTRTKNLTYTKEKQHD